MLDSDGHINIESFYASANKGKLRKEAYQFFYDKYVKNPFENYWIIEQQSRFEARKLNFFLPGSIYTFSYPNPISKDFLSYYDKRPIILVIGTYLAKTTGRYILQGINLNFVPERQKVELLDTYYRVFRKDLLEAEKNSDKGLLGQAKNLAKYLKDWTFMTKVFVTQGKIPLNFSIRNYDIKGILNPVLVEIEDWNMIPFFFPREFKGSSPAQIYADYITANFRFAVLGEKIKKSKKNFK